MIGAVDDNREVFSSGRGPVETEATVAELVERWRGGDPAAAELLFARYARRLTAVAERRLSPALAARLDGEDVVQSVFRTFFRRAAGGEFRIDGAGQLWRLLVTITLRKAAAKARYHAAGPRAVAAEAGPPDNKLVEAVAREPGPEDAAAVLDLIEALLRGLPDLYGDILRLRLEGHEVTAIAAQLGVSRRTIQRALNLLQQRLTDAEAGPTAGNPG